MIDDMKSYLMHQKENEVDFLNIDKKIVEIVYGYLILLCVIFFRIKIKYHIKQKI